MEVLHWWTSASERLALDHLLQRVNRDGVLWRSAPVPGGSVAAVPTLLRSRLLGRAPPDWAHLSMRNVRELARMGVLIDLGAQADWVRSLHPLAREAVTVDGTLRAVPLGLHRINTLLYHRGLWQAFGLPEPRRWSDIARCAEVLAREGVMPFVWSDEGAQLLTLFEILLLSALGPFRFRRLFQPGGWEDEGVLQALEHLRQLRALCPRSAGRALAWPLAGREFLLGRAGMWLSGDWARGELNAWGMRAGLDYGCVAVPGTEATYLYLVDGLAAFDRGPSTSPDLARLASILTEPALQRSFNRAKGSMGVRADVPDAPGDPAEAATLRDFQDPRIEKLPGLAHGLGLNGRRAEQTAELLAAFVRDTRRPPVGTWAELVRLNRGASA
ncbi:MAG: carbohydrate ABC transporter substrate-binding protein [Hydrogenophaga sp.]|nr:carbohydrate ABC transporter substrate-binding protein [Hydrogenophaga sp.]